MNRYLNRYSNSGNGCGENNRGNYDISFHDNRVRSLTAHFKVMTAFVVLMVTVVVMVDGG